MSFGLLLIHAIYCGREFMCSARHVCLQFESVSVPIGNNMSALYMCILLYVTLIWCSGVP